MQNRYKKVLNAVYNVRFVKYFVLNKSKFCFLKEVKIFFEKILIFVFTFEQIQNFKLEKCHG